MKLLLIVFLITASAYAQDHKIDDCASASVNKKYNSSIEQCRVDIEAEQLCGKNYCAPSKYGYDQLGEVKCSSNCEMIFFGTLTPDQKKVQSHKRILRSFIARELTHPCSSTLLGKANSAFIDYLNKDLLEEVNVEKQCQGHDKAVLQIAPNPYEFHRFVDFVVFEIERPEYQFFLDKVVAVYAGDKKELKKVIEEKKIRNKHKEKMITGMKKQREKIHEKLRKSKNFRKPQDSPPAPPPPKTDDENFVN